MSMDINGIKAGEYELVAHRWDERTSKPGEPFTFVRHRRGDVVELSEADARRLVLAGAVVEPGSLEKRTAEAAGRQYRAALAQLPDDIRRQLLADLAAEAGGADDETEDPDDDSGSAGESEPKRPATVANKDTWVAYRVAESDGELTAEELDGLTKAELQDDDLIAALRA